MHKDEEGKTVRDCTSDRPTVATDVPPKRGRKRKDAGSCDWNTFFSVGETNEATAAQARIAAMRRRVQERERTALVVAAS